MKAQDLKHVKIEVPELKPSSAMGDVRLVWPGKNEVMVGMIDYQVSPELNFYPNMPSKEEALKAAALFRASYEMQSSLKSAISRLQYLGETETLTYVRCVAALELSENLK